MPFISNLVSWTRQGRSAMRWAHAGLMRIVGDEDRARSDGRKKKK